MITQDVDTLKGLLIELSTLIIAYGTTQNQLTHYQLSYELDLYAKQILKELNL